jgi:hypothetical protein
LAPAWQSAAHRKRRRKRRKRRRGRHGHRTSGLLLWTVTRITRRVPVTEGGGQTATVVAVLFGAVSLLAGVWSLLRI